jgi:hypothetical protein
MSTRNLLFHEEGVVFNAFILVELEDLYFCFAQRNSLKQSTNINAVSDSYRSLTSVLSDLTGGNSSRQQDTDFTEE